jgi:hypothetical protein
LLVLAEGGYIMWRGLGLTFATQSVGEPPRVGPKLWVRVSTASGRDYITTARAEAELRNTQAGIAELASDSKDFAQLMSGRPVAYDLVYDYGTGSIGVATWSDQGFAYHWK